jgi:hydrogenase nickel incorporation protein HypA/HybF
MHETSVMCAVLEQVAALVRTHGASGVRRIALRVGLLSGVDPAALRFAFDALAPGGQARGARLDLAVEPGRYRCGDCGIETMSDRLAFVCPRCRGGLALLQAGREVVLQTVELTFAPQDRHEVCGGATCHV